LADPTAEKTCLLGAVGAEGVIVGEGFFGQDIEAGEQTERLVEVEIGNVTAAFFVEKFQGEQCIESINLPRWRQLTLPAVRLVAPQRQLTFPAVRLTTDPA
jgi:hypothetical protein